MIDLKKKCIYNSVDCARGRPCLFAIMLNAVGDICGLELMNKLLSEELRFSARVAVVVSLPFIIFVVAFDFV